MPYKENRFELRRPVIGLSFPGRIAVTAVAIWNEADQGNAAPLPNAGKQSGYNLKSPIFMQECSMKFNDFAQTYRL